MKLCIAQTYSISGDIESNIVNHKWLIDVAVRHAANIVVFPELSLTGYEPTLADGLAMDAGDERLDVFQVLSDTKGVMAGVGVPTRVNEGVCISMVLFRPNLPRLTYSKKYLHADEEPYFISGQNFPVIDIEGLAVALAICYEIFVPEHAQAAHEAGGQVYVASVAKAASGMARAAVRAPEIARATGMPVLLANCVGPADDFVGAGGLAVWAADGTLLAQLGAEVEGLLIYDTETEEVIEKII